MTPPDEFDTGVLPDDLDRDRPRPFDTPWGSFALYWVDNRVVAASSFCPHLLGPLFQGTQSGVEVTCPWHHWRYSLVTGECTDCPDPEEENPPPIEFLDVRIGPRGTYVLGRRA